MRCMTVVRTRRACSSPSSCARRSISRTFWCCLGLGLVDDLADERLARLAGRQAADPLELAQLTLLQLRDLCAFSFQEPQPLFEAFLPTLERLQLAVHALGPIQEEAFLSLQIGALFARLVLGRALDLERVVLTLEDDLFLL